MKTFKSLILYLSILSTLTVKSTDLSATGVVRVESHDQVHLNGGNDGQVGPASLGIRLPLPPV